jgi:hypothetical protein
MNRDRDDAPVRETSAIPPESARIQAPVSPASSVIQLQRTIGNRRVLKLLRETDPRMQWTKAAREENKGRDAEALPWNSPGDEMAGWRPLEILDKLTQVDENDTVTFTDEKRCGANAVLAVAITRGPLATEIFARGVMLKALGRSKAAEESAESRKTMGATYEDIWPAISAIGKGTATYGHLSLIAHYAKVVMSKNADGATTGHEVVAMAGLIGGMQPSTQPVEDAKHVAQLTDGLKPGESIIVNVDTDIPDPALKIRSSKLANHFMVLLKTKSQVLLYDPYPRTGSQLIRMPQGKADPADRFWGPFVDAEGRPKSTFVVARPKL